MTGWKTMRLASLLLSGSLGILALGWFPQFGHAEEAPAPLQPLIDRTGPGEVLTIPPGEYAGPVRIAKPLVLQAEGEVVINAVNEEPVLTIESDNVTIRGIRLLDNRINNPLATLVISGNGNRIEQVQIDTMGSGIQLRNANRNLLQEIRVTGHVLDPDEAASQIGHDHAAHQQLTQPAQKPGVEPKKGNGIDLLHSHENRIISSRIINVHDGIYLESSQQNEIVQNTVEKSRYGYHLMGTSGTVLADNTGSGNVTGAMLMDSSRALVQNNTFLKQRENPNSQGILLFSVTDSTLSRNLVEGNRVGLYLEQSTGNEITQNELSLNFIGMQTVQSADNQFRDNRFISNVVQAQAQDSENDRFDGNYWDDLQGLDVDGDGRSDLAYEMNPFFLALTDAVPPYQLFFQAPGFSLLENLFASGSVKVRDEAPLMVPPLADDGQKGTDPPAKAGMLGAGLLLFSLTFMYLGVRKK
mgnify:CR=1 FL=1